MNLIHTFMEPGDPSGVNFSGVLWYHHQLEISPEIRVIKSKITVPIHGLWSSAMNGDFDFTPDDHDLTAGKNGSTYYSWSSQYSLDGTNHLPRGASPR